MSVNRSPMFEDIEMEFLTAADVGARLELFPDELEELVGLGFLRVQRVVNGVEFFLRSEVEAVPVGAAALARHVRAMATVKRGRA